MAYSFRFRSSVGPTKLNRTSWGPVNTAPIELPNEIFGRPLSGNFDRIINSFDRTNAFECVRSAFEQAGHVKQEPCEKGIVDCPKRVEERFQASGDVVVNGRPHENHISSSYDRADVGLASKQTPCTDEEVTEYYRDRLYMSQARQLFPLQEDLADWINKTIGISHLTGENFLNMLDNGVELLQLATIIRDKAKEAADGGFYHGPVPQVRGRCWQRAARRSFFSRDNMENFITFCRQLGVHENLLFESDDLVLHAQPRNVILCLLELARIATKFKVEPPGLVQLEKEIALEEAGIAEEKDRLAASLAWQFQQEGEEKEEIRSALLDNASPDVSEAIPETVLSAENDDDRSVKTDDTWSRATSEDLDGVPLKPLTELDKRVQIVTRLMQRNCNCSEGKCSKLLKVKKVGEGRYNIAGRNVFIRLLKGRHMMVRVGGGWDTLEHFLTRHDPCQVRVISSQSSSTVQKVTTVDISPQSQALDATSIENAIRNSIEAATPNYYASDDIVNISSNDLTLSAVDSASETSSVNSVTLSSKISNGKVSHSSGKSTPNSIKSYSTASKCSFSGRTTPQSAGKTSPRNIKSPVNGKQTMEIKPIMNGKMSPANLKLDLMSSTNNRRIKSSNVINNRMISPIESSTRLFPATPRPSSQNRTLRTPTNEGRKSFPSAIVTENNTTRRRSLNLSIPSTPVKSTKSTPRNVRTAQNNKCTNGSSASNVSSVKSPNCTPPLMSPTVEKNIKLTLPLQTNNSPNKSFLHIRAKYRSPPPRDVPPREY